VRHRVLDAEEAYGLAGTSLQGHVRADYETLVEVFGKPDPNMCDGYKTDVEWCVSKSKMMTDISTSSVSTTGRTGRTT
jgi:hypothetical protein